MTTSIVKNRRRTYIYIYIVLLSAIFVKHALNSHFAARKITLPDSRGLQPPGSYAYALTEVCEHVSELGGGDVALSLAVESLERLHEVGERADVRLRVDRLVDRQDLLELVLLLA